MDYIYLKEFLENYSLPTLIIAVIVAVITLLYDKFLSQKLPNVIRNFIPFAISIILYFSYDMVFVVKNFSFSTGTFSAGMLSGSLSVILTSSVYRLKNGKPLNTNAVYLIIESLITDYVATENVYSVASALSEVVNGTNENANQTVYNLLLEHTHKGIDEQEIKALSFLIVKATNAVKIK